MNTRDQYEFQRELNELLAKYNRYITSAGYDRDGWIVSFKPIPIDYTDTTPYTLPVIYIDGVDVTRYCEISESSGNVWIPFDRIKLAKKQADTA